MKKSEAAEILHKHNLWRSDWGDDSKMQSPHQVTIAIDTAVKYLRESIKAGKIAKKKAMKAKKIG